MGRGGNYSNNNFCVPSPPSLSSISCLCHRDPREMGKTVPIQRLVSKPRVNSCNSEVGVNILLWYVQIPVTLEWVDGQSVSVAGSFSNWDPIPLARR